MLKKNEKGKNDNPNVYYKGEERGWVMKKKEAGNANTNKAKTITGAVRTDVSTLVEKDVVAKMGLIVDAASSPTPHGILKDSGGSKKKTGNVRDAEKKKSMEMVGVRTPTHVGP